MIAKATRQRLITTQEMQLLSTPNGRLTTPLDSDKVTDQALGREIYLRRYAALSRVTVFEGGHEGIAEAGVDWLARFQTNDLGQNIKVDGNKQSQ